MCVNWLTETGRDDDCKLKMIMFVENMINILQCGNHRETEKCILPQFDEVE